MTKLMATASIYTLTALDMKAPGKMTYSTDRAKKLGLMEVSMRVNTWLVKNMDKAFTAGMTVQGMEVNGMKIKLKALVLTLG